MRILLKVKKRRRNDYLGPRLARQYRDKTAAISKSVLFDAASRARAVYTVSVTGPGRLPLGSLSLGDWRFVRKTEII
jgi:hypothetical protein